MVVERAHGVFRNTRDTLNDLVRALRPDLGGARERHHVELLAAEALQVGQARGIFRIAEQNIAAGLPGAAGAASAVNERVKVLGNLKVNNKVHHGNVEATSSDISRDEALSLAAAESVESDFAGSLGHVAVEGAARDFGLLNILVLAQLDCHGLGWHEDEGLAVLGTVKVEHTRDGRKARLRDRRHGDELNAGRDLLSVVTDQIDHLALVEKLVGNGANFRCHSGAEHQSLALRLGRHLLEDLLDLSLEAHLEHFVSLVEDHAFHVFERELAAQKHVVDAAGSSDNHIRAFRELVDLPLNRRTAIDADAPEARRQALKLGVNLQGQLASREQHDSAGLVGPGDRFTRVEPVKNRQCEGHGLSRAGT
mmetsp:Transcript_25890/g.73355  ORF Transcript_25890/g.73355 Transcript_25890/m.73355 type:complete len:366 (-) Transcript_25890:470-1567(-)